MTHAKHALLNAALLILVLIALALGLEGYARLTQPLIELGKSRWYLPELFEMAAKQEFVDLYDDHDGTMDLTNYDPQLGWDYHQDHHRIRPPANPAPGRRSAGPRILVIGDSFANGNEVGDHEHLAHRLGEILPRAEVFSMGAGGYGLDQTLLKYLSHGSGYRPDAVVLVLFPAMYTRSSLSFSSYAKPYLLLDGTAPGGLMVTETPVPPPPRVLPALRHELARTSHALAYLHYLVSGLQPVAKQLQEAYFAHMDQLVSRILARLRDDVAEQGGHLLVVEVPGGNAYQTGQYNHVIRRHLWDIYRQLGLTESLIVDQVWLQRFTSGQIVRELYLNPPERNRPIGHLSAAGNRELARDVAARLCHNRTTAERLGCGAGTDQDKAPTERALEPWHALLNFRLEESR